jgi:hypothetical protein
MTAIHPDRMVALPENRSLIISAPGQGEMKITTALVDLQLKIMLGTSHAIAIANLKHQINVKAAFTQGRHPGCIRGQNSMSKGFATEIRRGGDKLQQF